MSRSWRSSWGAELKVRESRAERKDEWKHNIQRELDEVTDIDISKVYIIVNEWSPDDSDESLSEVVGAKFFLTEDAAWDNLDVIADSFGVSVEHDDTSFEVPSDHLLGLSRDEYRIEELNR